MTQLSRHVLETLWEDGDFVLSRSAIDGEQVLVLAPASERPATGIITRLEHSYALREELEPFRWPGLRGWCITEVTGASVEDTGVICWLSSSDARGSHGSSCASPSALARCSASVPRTRPHSP